MTSCIRFVSNSSAGPPHRGTARGRRAQQGRPRDDEEQLVELELRELLSRYGFDGESTPIVRVSGLGALRGAPLRTERAVDLPRAVDEHVPVLPRPVERPFPMAIENVLTSTGRDTVLTGAIEQGTVTVGESVEVVGLGPSRTSVVTGLETFGKTLDRAEAGDNAAVLRGVRREEVRRGQVLCAPGSVAPHTVTLRGTEFARSGDPVDMVVEPGKPIAMDVGLGFATREGNRMVGAGTVQELLD